MIPADDATTLSLLYHINSEPWDNTEAYQAARDYEVEYKDMVSADGTLMLPSPSETPLMRLLQGRDSCRDYSGRLMPAQVLSNPSGRSVSARHHQPAASSRSKFTRSLEESRGL